MSVCVCVCECDQFTSLEAVMAKGAQEVADFVVAFSLLERFVTLRSDGSSVVVLCVSIE